MTITYKGFTGTITAIDWAERLILGQVELGGVLNILTGESVVQFEASFRDSIDEYLEQAL